MAKTVIVSKLISSFTGLKMIQVLFHSNTVILLKYYQLAAEPEIAVGHWPFFKDLAEQK